MYRTSPERGFTLVTAVFIIVVVALLAAFMVTIGTTQRQVSTWSILGARAYAAAASGMERAVHGALAGGCAAVPAGFTLTGGTLAGYQVTLQCSAETVTEGTDTYAVYALTATASFGAPGSADFVGRTLTATVTDAP